MNNVVKLFVSFIYALGLLFVLSLFIDTTGYEVIYLPFLAVIIYYLRSKIPIKDKKINLKNPRDRILIAAGFIVLLIIVAIEISYFFAPPF